MCRTAYLASDGCVGVWVGGGEGGCITEHVKSTADSSFCRIQVMMLDNEIKSPGIITASAPHARQQTRFTVLQQTAAKATLC